MPHADGWFAIQGFDTHLSHQATDALAADRLPLIPEQVAQHSAPGKRIFQVQLVHLEHQRQVFRRGRFGLGLFDVSPHGMRDQDVRTPAG